MIQVSFPGVVRPIVVKIVQRVLKRCMARIGICLSVLEKLRTVIFAVSYRLESQALVTENLPLHLSSTGERVLVFDSIHHLACQPQSLNRLTLPIRFRSRPSDCGPT